MSLRNRESMVTHVNAAPRNVSRALLHLLANKIDAVTIDGTKNRKSGFSTPAYHRSLIRLALLEIGITPETPEGHYEALGINVDTAQLVTPGGVDTDISLQLFTFTNASAGLVVVDGDLYLPGPFRPAQSVVVKVGRSQHVVEKEKNMYGDSYVMQEVIPTGIPMMRVPSLDPATIAVHGEQLLEGTISTIQTGANSSL